MSGGIVINNDILTTAWKRLAVAPVTHAMPGQPRTKGTNQMKIAHHVFSSEGLSATEFIECRQKAGQP